MDSVRGFVTGLELTEICNQLLAQRRRLFLPENSPSRPSDLLRPARSRHGPSLPYRLAQLRTDCYVLHVSHAGLIDAIRLPTFRKIRRVKIVLSCNATRVNSAYRRA